MNELQHFKWHFPSTRCVNDKTKTAFTRPFGKLQLQLLNNGGIFLGSRFFASSLRLVSEAEEMFHSLFSHLSALVGNVLRHFVHATVFIVVAKLCFSFSQDDETRWRLLRASIFHSIFDSESSRPYSNGSIILALVFALRCSIRFSTVLVAEVKKLETSN